MFNVILLFTKPLLRFKVVHHFKPLLDAFQGPFKYQYYYWFGTQLLVRNVIVLLAILGKNISVTVSCIIAMTVAIIQGYIQPYKNKIINIQELLLLYNVVTMCVLLIFNGNVNYLVQRCHNVCITQHNHSKCDGWSVISSLSDHFSLSSVCFCDHHLLYQINYKYNNCMELYI